MRFVAHEDDKVIHSLNCYFLYKNKIPANLFWTQLSTKVAKLVLLDTKLKARNNQVYIKL